MIKKEPITKDGYIKLIDDNERYKNSNNNYEKIKSIKK